LAPLLSMVIVLGNTRAVWRARRSTAARSARGEHEARSRSVRLSVDGPVQVLPLPRTLMCPIRQLMPILGASASPEQRGQHRQDSGSTNDEP
jgi:hypothetical protein